MGYVFVDYDGTAYSTGNNPAPVTNRMKAMPYGEDERTPMVPESDWENIARQFVPDAPSLPLMNYIHDQNGYGMCNCSATASAMELSNLRSTGSYDQLSAGDLYRRISGGSDNGSTLEDGLEESQHGIASVSEVPYLEWHGRGTPSTRKKAVVLEYYLAPSFAACFSGVCYGFDLITGIMWYDNYQPDSSGRLPSRGRGNGGGHAIHGYKPGWIDGRPYIWHKNSWTKRYGLEGHFAIGRDNYGSSIGGWWLVRVVTAPVTNPLPVPIF